MGQHGIGPAQQARKAATVGASVVDFLDRRTASGNEPATVAFLKEAGRKLTDYIGPNATIRSVTAETAREFRRHLQSREPKLSAYTINRTLRACGTIFIAAGEDKLTDANPFHRVRVAASAKPGRKQYVPADVVHRVIEHADRHYRLILALTRFGGLRRPNEVLSLKWEHVDLPQLRMTVSSPKTEHIAGKEYRVVPIFPALLPFLQEAFEIAEPGAEYVVGGRHREKATGPAGWKGCNLTQQVYRLIRRANVAKWPKLFNNLRASYAADLHKS